MCFSNVARTIFMLLICRQSHYLRDVCMIAAVAPISLQAFWHQLHALDEQFFTRYKSFHFLIINYIKTFRCQVKVKYRATNSRRWQVLYCNPLVAIKICDQFQYLKSKSIIFAFHLAIFTCDFTQLEKHFIRAVKYGVLRQ